MNKLGVTFSAMGVFATLNFAEGFKVDVKPAHYGAFTYLGVINPKGDTTRSNGTTGEAIDNQPYSRFGGWISMGATLEDRTDINVTLAMMTWNSLPLTKGSPFTRVQSLGSNLGQAYLTHKFGNLEAPYLTLKFGAFPYAYSSSKNLGGHMLTGGTYPGVLTSNFWTLIDGNDYAAQGALGHFSFFDNALNVDALAFFEHGVEPNYDLSPGIVASYKIGGMIEIGAGAVFSHLLAWDEDAVTPKVRNNAYLPDSIRLPEAEWNKPGLERNDTLIIDSADSRFNNTLQASSRPDLAAKGIAVKYYTASQSGIPNSELEYYTFRGVKAMARIAVTPLRIGDNPKKVSIYSEANLLGVKNYPFYYQKRTERMLLMVGANIPLPYGLEITGEAEHYKNKFMNNVRTAYEDVLPQWRERQSDFFVPVLDENGNPKPNTSGGFEVTDTPRASHENGEWFWSFTARKTVYDRVNFSAKLAHDFLRLYNFFGNPSDEPAFKHNYGWYFAFKSEISI